MLFHRKSYNYRAIVALGFFLGGVSVQAEQLSVNVPDAVVARMVAAIKGQAAARAQPGIPAQPMTDEQAKKVILHIGLAQAKQQTIGWERSQKTKEAAKSVPPLEIPSQ